MNKSIINKIYELAENIQQELVSIRRDIHAHPELGFKETRTSSLIASRLESLGIEVQRDIAITGVVGILRGNNPGRTILLRADMDCLEVEELNDVEYKSEAKGLMHACGHDGHTTWLLGAAMILSKLKDEIHGNVKFVFQPCEELSGGAEKLIEEGVLENPKVDAAIGAHIWPSIPSGSIGIKYGPMMGAPDAFKIIIKGKGGHGAAPQNCVDPISISCQIYNSIQNGLTRRVDPLEPVLLSICKFNSGSTYNVIPDIAEMEGTIRTLSNEARKILPKMLEDIVRSVCQCNGATYEFKYQAFCPPVINDNNTTSLVERVSKELMGENKVIKLEKPTMIGEDFSNYQQKVPGTFIYIGNYNEDKNLIYGLHNPRFNLDEDVLAKTSALFAALTVEYLNENLD